MNTNIYFEEKLINKAGVDRLVFSHVELIEINRSILHSAVTESSNLIFDDLKVYNRTHYVTNNGDRFHHMRISDPEIGTLTFGANPQKYGIWEFSPCNFRDGNNLVNFSSRELIDYLEYAAKLLNERFGLVISFFNSILKEIELNTTFALRYAFSDYYRPLSVLFLRMPYLKKQCEYSGTENKGKKLHSCSTFNKQISVTAYNKSLEMAVNLKSKERILVYDEDGVIVDSDLMRVEFKLKTAEICKKWLPDLHTIEDLSDEMIYKAFRDLVEHYIFTPLEKWGKENKQYLNRLVKPCVKNSKKGYNWKSKLLMELKNKELKEREVKLLDVRDLNLVISNYTDRSGHKGRLLLKEDFTGFANNDVFLQNDREKLNEIVESLKHSFRFDSDL